jgi:hypothetical protein
MPRPQIKKESVFLFVSYVFNEEVLNRYKLRNTQISAIRKVFFLLQMDERDISLLPKDVPFYLFNEDTSDCSGSQVCVTFENCPDIATYGKSRYF